WFTRFTNPRRADARSERISSSITSLGRVAWDYRTSISAIGSKDRPKWTTSAVSFLRSGYRLTAGRESRRSSTDREIDQQLDIEHDENGAGECGKQRHPAGRDKRAHLDPVGGEHHQRHDRERQRKAQNHLTQDQELRRSRLSIPNRYAGGGYDGDGTCHKPPRPRRQTDVDKTFHHDLTSQCCRHSGVHPTTQQCNRE